MSETTTTVNVSEHRSISSSGHIQQHRHQQHQQVQQKSTLSQPQPLKPSANATIATPVSLQAKCSVPLGVKPSGSIPLSSRPQLHPVKAETAYHRIHAGPLTSAQHNGNTHSNGSQPPSESMVIKTSKKWVLPPRPKPGRKPSAAHSSAVSHNHSQSHASNSAAHSSNHIGTHSHKEVPMGKSHSVPNSKGHIAGTGVPIKPLSSLSTSSSTANSANSSKMSSRAGSPTSGSLPLLTRQQHVRSVSPEVDLHRSKPIAMAPKPEPKGLNVGNLNVAANPLKQAIIKVNEENYYLKLEVIKLVSDLKSLRSELLQQRKPLKSVAAKPVSPMTVLNEAYSHKMKQEEDSLYEKEESREIKVKLETPEPPQTKKRLHDDDDMNDLILSLVDLSHTSKKEEEDDCDDKGDQNDQNDSDDNESTTTAVELTDDKTEKVKEEGKRAEPHIAETLPSGLDHSDDDEPELLSSTPDSLLTLTKTNSSIDELELPSSNQCVQSLSGTTEVAGPEEFDMPVSWSKMALDDAKIFKMNSTNNASNGFTFQGDFYDNTKIRQRQLERENEIKKYNVMNELLDFQNHSYEIGDIDIEFDAFMNGGARVEYSSDLSIF